MLPPGASVLWPGARTGRGSVPESGWGAGAELTGPPLSAEHAAVLLHRAFLVGMYGQMDTSAQISEALRILHLEAVM